MRKVNEEEICKFMSQVEHYTKDQLARIKQMDQDTTIKQAQYLCLASSLTSQSCHSGNSSDPNHSTTLQKAQELGQQITGQLKEKVIVAERLYCRLADWCEEFEDFMETDIGNGEVSESLLLQWVGSEEVSAIILECQAKEMEGMCVCGGKEESSQMIKCDGEYCKRRWFHLKCVGIKRANRLPTGKWTCPGCRPQLTKTK